VISQRQLDHIRKGTYHWTDRSSTINAEGGVSDIVTTAETEDNASEPMSSTLSAGVPFLDTLTRADSAILEPIRVFHSQLSGSALFS
jgi:hypothetical protein